MRVPWLNRDYGVSDGTTFGAYEILLSDSFKSNRIFLFASLEWVGYGVRWIRW